MATLEDIASSLNLNKTTVSKALNDSSDISLITKKRVREEAERIGYAKGKKRHITGSGTIIGIICPEVLSYYYSEMLTYLSSNLQKKGFQTLLSLSGFSPDAERQQLEQFVRINVSGVIIITEQADISSAIKSVPNSDMVPIVIMGLNYKAKDRDVVSIDEEYAIRSIVDHMLSLGHSSIAFIGEELVSSRLHFLQEAVKAHGFSIPREYIALTEKRNEECGYYGMKQLLALKERPTAVFAGYDAIALGAYRALIEQGIRIPDDISLVGFDNANFCAFLPISLTSVDYDVEAECRVAAAILLGRISDGRNRLTQSVAINPKLVIRESTGRKI